MTTRILPLARIPGVLWSKGLLHLPAQLVLAYKQRLTETGLLEEASKPSIKKDIHGGETVEATHEHFAHRYAVSAARPEAVALDPNEVLAEIPDALLSTFSQGNVALLDIPCGAGTTTAAMISTIAALRECGTLPRLPLSVFVTGGDSSDEALNLAEGMFQCIRDYAMKQGITFAWSLRKWNAIKPEETAELVDVWFDSSNGAEEYVVCISNFSGALIKAGLYEQFEPCLEQILARLYDKKSTLLWVEPETSDASKKLLPKIWDFLSARLPAFIVGQKKASPDSIKYDLWHPIISSKISTGTIVQRFSRV